MTQLQQWQQQESPDQETSTTDVEASLYQAKLTLGPTLKHHYMFNFDDSFFTPTGPSQPMRTQVQKCEDHRHY
jgi:hypothetical protein